ncbi:MAG TPA: helix-turn-helix domain-containing protein [Coriobacteriia bacterium]
MRERERSAGAGMPTASHEPSVPRAWDTPEPGVIAALEPGRRGQILDAALGVFAEKGYSSGSMRDIAKRVGVTEPALYRHFAGKEALFLALVRVVTSHLRDEAFEILDAVRPETFRAQIAAALADRRRAIAFFGPVLRTVATAAAYNPAVLDEIATRVIAPVRARLIAKAELLDEAYGVESDAASREARVRAFLALFVGSLATSVVIGDQPDEAIADAIVRVMGWEGRA